MSEDGHSMDGSDGRTPVNRTAGTVEQPGLQGPTRLPDGREHASSADTPVVGESPALAKILPFPRDWFGPVDDLVPVFPELANGSAISAASFWDENADAVYQAVESLDRRWVGDGVGDNRVLPIPGDAAPDSAPDPVVEPDSPELASGPPEVGSASARVAFGRRDAGPGSLERVRRRRPAATIAAALGLVLVCAAVVLLVLSGGLRHQLFPPKATHVSRHTVHAKSTAAVNPPQILTLVVATKAPVKTRRHRRRKVVAHPAGNRTKASRAVSVNSVAAPAEPAAPRAPSNSSAAAQGTGASAAGGCVQSPDSGCMP